MADESRRDSRSRLGSRCLRTAKSCRLRVIVFKPSRPLYRARAQGRGREPPRVQSAWDEATGPAGDARGSTAPAPQSKPVAPASRLVAQVAPSVASGLGLRILAAGPAINRLYSYSRRLCEPDLKSLLGRILLAGGRARPDGACPPRNHRPRPRPQEAASRTGTSADGHLPHRPLLRSDDDAG